MPIAIACQHCDWKGKVDDALAGKKGKCPTCGELVPIPKKSAPPPVPGKKAVGNEPDVVDDADIVDDAEVVDDRPSKSRGAAARRRPDDDEDDRPSRARRRVDDDDEDDRPSRSRRRPADDDEDDDRPSRARRRVDDDEDEDRPARSRRRDDEDDEEERPRKRRGGPRRRPKKKGGASNAKIGAIVGGIVFLLIGVGLLAFWFAVGGKRFPIWAVIIIITSLISIGQAVMRSDDDDDGSHD